MVSLCTLVTTMYPFFLLSPSPPLFSLRAMGGREGAKSGPGFDKCSLIFFMEIHICVNKASPKSTRNWHY